MILSLAASHGALAQNTAPDLSGIWMLGGGMAGGAGGRRFSMEEPPLQPWAFEKYKETRAGLTDPNDGGRNEFDPSAFCFPPGAARSMMMPFAFEIVQRPDQVYILFEFDSGIRRIYTDGRKHAEELDPAWMGHSTGKWEGDTLVVDTVSLREETWLDRVGTPHSDALRIVERFRRLNRDTLEVEFRFEDPKAFTKPWGGKKIYALQATEMGEFVLCEEHLGMGTIRGKTPAVP
jgi:hypothetical protein